MLVDVTAVDYLGQPDDFRMNLEVWDQNRAVMRRQPQRGDLLATGSKCGRPSLRNQQLSCVL